MIFNLIKNKSSNIIEAINSDYTDLQQKVNNRLLGIVKKPINYDDLKSYKINEEVWLTSKICFVRRADRFKGKDTLLSFEVMMKKGGKFGKHFHNDVIESSEVISGELHDLVDGRKYKAGEVLHYNKNKEHTPVALEKSFLHVLFKK